jgi:hypothetical protein
MVPAVACMGEKAPFFRAHEIMGRGYARMPLMTSPWTFVSRRRMPSW